VAWKIENKNKIYIFPKNFPKTPLFGLNETKFIVSDARSSSEKTNRCIKSSEKGELMTPERVQTAIAQ
jgi:hypothetical protein